MSRCSVRLLCFAVWLVPVGLVDAQAPVRTISVTGFAEKELSPDRYTIEVTIQVEGKTTELARAEYRKRIEQVRTTFNEMDFPELTIDSTGRTISDSPQFNGNQMQIMMMMQEGAPESPAEPTFYIREVLQFRWSVAPQAPLAELEQALGGLLDRVRTEKLDFAGQSETNYYPPQARSLVTGTHTRVQAELRALRGLAFADARQQAAEAAVLAGSKLGRVLEVTLADEEDLGGFSAHAPGSFDPDPPFACKLGSKLQLRTAVRVKFELE